jgi:O-antigen/teichoic acid export membrane protein
VRLLRSSAVYAGSSLVNKAIPFLILPILTRYLTPAEYGFVAVFQVLVTFVSPAVDLNLSQNIMRKYHRLDRARMAEYISNILTVLLSTFAIVTVAVAAVSLFTGDMFGLPARWLNVLPVIALMNMVNKCNLVLLIQQSRAVTYGLYEIGSTALNVTLTLILIIGYGWTWQGRTTAILIAAIVVGLIGFVHMWRRGFFRWKLAKASVREIMIVSLPLVPHTVGMVLIGFSDRLILDWMLGKEAVGLYAVGYQFGMITMLFGDAFLKAWSPWFFKRIQDSHGDDRKRIVRYTYAFLAGLYGIAIVVVIGSHLIFPLMIDRAFAGGKQFIVWIALAYATRGIYQVMLLYMLHEGKTRFLAVNTGFAAILNIVLNVVLIRANGPIGAAQASLIAFGVMSLGSWWYAGRIHRMPWFSDWVSFARGT